MEVNEQTQLIDLYYNYFDNNNYKDALTVLFKMELNPKDSSWIYSKIAECHYELFEYQKAVDYCLESLKVQPKYPFAMWTLANAYYYLGEYESSIKLLKKILKLSVEDIGKVETKMGIRWARSLHMDSYLKAVDCYYMLEKDNKAIEYYDQFKNLKKLKIKSYLPIKYLKEIEIKMKEVMNNN